MYWETLLLVSLLRFRMNRVAMSRAKSHSIMFNALKTRLPIPKPRGRVIPGALNFSQASMKLMAETNPIHRKVTGSATCFIVCCIGCIYKFIMVLLMTDSPVIFTINMS